MGRPLLVTADIQTLPTSEFFNSLGEVQTRSAQWIRHHTATGNRIDHRDVVNQSEDRAFADKFTALMAQPSVSLGVFFC